MNKVTFFRGTYVEKGSPISNPLYLPNRRAERYNKITLDDSYGLPFYVCRSTKESDLNYFKRLAEDRAWESAYPKELTDQIVVSFEINEINFSIFSGKIRQPYGDRSAFSSFNELFDCLQPYVLTTTTQLSIPTRETQLHIRTKDISLTDLNSVPIKIGRRNFLGKFIYKDFVVPNEGIEGDIKHPSERK